MPKLWGLDLKAIHWNKFKPSYMFSDVYHLRTTKFVLFQWALLFFIVAQALAVAALKDYVKEQSQFRAMAEGGTINSNNFIGIAAYTIVVGLFVASLLGGAFILDLFWPERSESHRVMWAWRNCSVVVCAMALADAVAFTIVVIARDAHFEGIDPVLGAGLLQAVQPNPELVYRQNAVCIASLAFLWLGFVATLASICVLLVSSYHDEKHGVFSQHYLRRSLIEKPVGSDKGDSGTSIRVQTGTKVDTLAVGQRNRASGPPQKRSAGLVTTPQQDA